VVIGFVAVLVGAGVGAAVARLQPGTPPEEHLKAAQQALWDDDPVAARAHLDRLLTESPNDPEGLLLAIQAARRTDACADAERLLTDYERQFRSTPATRREWVLLGVQQGDLGDHEDELLTLLTRGDRDRPVILEALAKGYFVSYRWPEAVVALTRLIEERPNHVPALLLRGKLEVRMRNFDEAQRDLRKAVEQAPGNPAARAALADLLNRVGHTREAIYNFELALRAGATDPGVRLGLARALADHADLAAADRQLADVPNHADAFVERGRLALRQGRAADAAGYLEQAVKLAPWHRDGHTLLLAAARELGRLDAVARVEARVAELTVEDGVGGRLKLKARDHPKDTAVRWELWQWSQRNGQMEEGFAWLTEILRADPKHAGAHAAKADHFERTGQPRRAAQHRAGRP
jgi:tetratricopeptide (TPR) repeat protein